MPPLTLKLELNGYSKKVRIISFIAHRREHCVRVTIILIVVRFFRLAVRGGSVTFDADGPRCIPTFFETA